MKTCWNLIVRIFIGFNLIHKQWMNLKRLRNQIASMICTGFNMIVWKRIAWIFCVGFNLRYNQWMKIFTFMVCFGFNLCCCHADKGKWLLVCFLFFFVLFFYPLIVICLSYPLIGTAEYYIFCSEKLQYFCSAMKVGAFFSNEKMNIFPSFKPVILLTFPTYLIMEVLKDDTLFSCDAKV